MTRALRDRGIPAVCIDARHAKAALKLQINKTDANDTHGLVQVTRTGWFREVTIKSMDAQTLRLLLVTRAQLVSQRQAIANTLRGLLKTFGLIVRRGAAGPFAARAREVSQDNAAFSIIVEPMLAVWQNLREQIVVIDRELLFRAKNDAAARRLTTIPAVGVIAALAYTDLIDTPARFGNHVLSERISAWPRGVISRARLTARATSPSAATHWRGHTFSSAPTPF